jgi:phosphoglycolate phosphatase-like HAD superfamily hydrolase
MHVCLFDIDGTLIASGGAGKAALEAALADEFGVDPQLHRVPYSGRTDRAIIRDLFRRYGLDDASANVERLLRAYLSHLPPSLRRHQGRVLPGVAALLGALRPRADVALGLLTGNVRDGARLKLGHYDLFHHFAFGGFGDDHHDRDDVARAALAAVHGHLNGAVDLGRVWVIGDTPLDIQCGRAIGARVAAVATGWHPLDELAAGNPDLLFADLTDPGPLLAVLG